DGKVPARALRADRPQGRPEGRGPHRAREGARNVNRRGGAGDDPGEIGLDPAPLGWISMDRPKLGASTRVVRAARSLPPGEGTPVVPPLVQSVAFDYGSAAEQDAVFGGERSGYVYGRYGTPTTAALERALAELDGVEAVTGLGTGMRGVAAAGRACGIAARARVAAPEDCR